jgi:broad specificity phosphatase PhoE
LAKIILVRHGETAWNKERRIQGYESDIPLSEAGKQQAEALALRLKNEKITAVYSSPLQRALDTAKAIAACHHLAVNTLTSLKEIKVGALEGRLASELLMRFDEFISGNGGEKNPQMPPGGESLEDVQKRAWDTISGLAAQEPQGTLVVVSHYFVILSVICRVLNLPLNQIVRLRLSTGTLSAVSIENGNSRLELFNEGSHTLKS